MDNKLLKLIDADEIEHFIRNITQIVINNYLII